MKAAKARAGITVFFCALPFWVQFVPAHAQQAPDAGRTLQEERLRAPLTPRDSPSLTIPNASSPPPSQGGPKVTLGGIDFIGNSLFTRAELTAVAGRVGNQSYDLAGLRGLTDRVARHYEQAGYPFVRVVLPEQELLHDGTLQLRIIEGRYGKVTALGEPTLAIAAQRYLSILKPNELIESSTLERTTLLLTDLPGIKISPVIRPGTEVGTGDLDLTITPGKRFSGRIGLDNHGNYYSGQWRTQAGLNINSPFMPGDQISLNALYTNEKLWLGQAMYSLPIGSSGLRGNMGHGQTTYALANGFEGNEGTAQISNASLNFPLIRSQRTNLNVGAGWQYKQLYNSYYYGVATERYHSTAVPVTLGFDHRDNFAGGGLSYGALTWTHGHLHKNDPIRRGVFNKLNLDLIRLQALPGNVSLYLRFSGQWAGKNLDSSESMTLGGPSSVRAYPLGESSGDQGWLTQLELRFRFGEVMPYLFYDYGHMKINAQPNLLALPAPANTRAGAGVGVRYQNASWAIDGAVALRTRGGAPTSDTHADPKPRFWLTASYLF